jgi:alkylated DNA repair dioxygenase AlkB
MESTERKRPVEEVEEQGYAKRRAGALEWGGSQVKTVYGARGGSAWVWYQPRFLSLEEARDLQEELKTLDMPRERVVMRGKPITVERRTMAFSWGGEQLVYRYAGKDLVANPNMPPELTKVMRRLREESGIPFNFILINRYSHGRVALGYHSDDERSMVDGMPVAGLSLGEARDMCFRDKHTKKPCAKQPLASGSLIVMTGATQRETEHSIPARANATRPRFSGTARVMKPSPPLCPK